MSLGVPIPAFINLVTDKAVAAWNSMLGTVGSGFGMGDGATWGFSEKQANLQTIVGNVGDVVIEKALAPLTTAWPNSISAESFRLYLYNFWLTLNQVCVNANILSPTINSVDSLMEWYNFGNGATYWQCLAAPDWTTAYSALSSGSSPNPLNVYFSVVQGGSYQGTSFPNALGKLVVVAGTPTTTLGYIIPFANYAGGYAYWTWSGGTGSGTVTVTGLDQQGNAETWTVNQVGAAGSTLMTPTNRAYSLITKVLTISAAAAVTATTGYVEAHPPAGRSNPPS